MTFMDGLNYTTAAALTAVAVWRATAVVRYGDIQRRALWGCYSGYAAAIWLKSPVGADVLRHVPVPELSVLLQQCLGAVAIASIIAYVSSIYGRNHRASPPKYAAAFRRVARLSPRIAIGVVAALGLVFFTAVDRDASNSPTDFAAAHIGEWGAALFMTILYSYLAVSCVVTGYQCASAARRAETRLLRTGLALMATAMVLGLLYVVVRTTYLWIAVFIPASRPAAPVITQLTAGLEAVLLLVFAAGGSVPAATALTARCSLLRRLWELYPLWRDLVSVFPEVAFNGRLTRSKLPSRLRELTNWALPLSVRLSIRVHTLADAVEQLRNYAPAGLFYAAEDEVEECAEARPNPQAAAEALYIKAALRAVAHGRRTHTSSEPLPRKPLVSTEDEARWWVQVQREYTAVSPQLAEDLLRSVSPEPTETS